MEEIYLAIDAGTLTAYLPILDAATPDTPALQSFGNEKCICTMTH